MHVPHTLSLSLFIFILQLRKYFIQCFLLCYVTLHTFSHFSVGLFFIQLFLHCSEEAHFFSAQLHRRRTPQKGFSLEPVYYVSFRLLLDCRCADERAMHPFFLTLQVLLLCVHDTVFIQLFVALLPTVGADIDHDQTIFTKPVQWRNGGGLRANAPKIYSFGTFLYSIFCILNQQRNNHIITTWKTSLLSKRI